MLEELTGKLESMSCIRLLSKLNTVDTIPVHNLESGDIDPNQIFHTVSPALAFQFITDESSTDVT